MASEVENRYRQDVEEAFREVLDNKDEYWDVVQAIRGKRPIRSIIAESGEAFAEASRDYEVLAPVVANTTRALRDGASTSEFKMMSAVNKVLTIVAILAPVIEGGIAAYQATNGGDPNVGGSFILTGISVFLKTFIADRYAKGRVLIKQRAVESPFEVEVVDENSDSGAGWPGR